MDKLLSQLRTTFTDPKDGFEGTVHQSLVQYVKEGHSDWNKYRIFAPCKYARNLVEICMEFECIVICWDDNQESPVHNHTEQNCWFAVLEGNVEEVYYSYDEQTGKLTQGGSASFSCGQVSMIKDDIALHKVRSVGGKACTLHIYNKPIPFCNVYDPVTGEVTQRKCGFFSVKGQKQCNELTAMYQEIYRCLEEMLSADPLFSTTCSIPRCPSSLATSKSSSSSSLLSDSLLSDSLLSDSLSSNKSQSTSNSSLPSTALSEKKFLSNTTESSFMAKGDSSIMSIVSENFGTSRSKEEFSAW